VNKPLQRRDALLAASSTAAYRFSRLHRSINVIAFMTPAIDWHTCPLGRLDAAYTRIVFNTRDLLLKWRWPYNATQSQGQSRKAMSRPQHP